MIAKNNRFPMRKDFLDFRDKATKLVSKHLLLYFQKTSSNPRIAVVVPKKTANLAAYRNQLKRLSKSKLIKKAKSDSLDLVLLFKPVKLEKSQKAKEKIKNEIDKLLSKTN